MKQIAGWRRVPQPPVAADQVDRIVLETGADRADILRSLQEQQERAEVWQDDFYQVTKIDHGGGAVCLVVAPILQGAHDLSTRITWDKMQSIKNELVGGEYEAVELYPAMSRNLSGIRQRYLWCNTAPGYRFPFGFATAPAVLPN